jgi:hypothetical protein
VVSVGGSDKPSAAASPNPPFQLTASREIGGFLTRSGALAAAERHTVGPPSVSRMSTGMFAFEQ